MCFAVPGKVVEFVDENNSCVIVDYESEKRKVNNLFDELKLGDFVLVSCGFIVKIINKIQAEKFIKCVTEGL